MVERPPHHEQATDSDANDPSDDGRQSGGSPGDPANPDGDATPLFRRDVLAACAATGAAALGVGTGAAGAQSGEDGTWFETAQLEHDVESYHYNFNEWAGTTHAEYGLHAQYAHYDHENDEFHPHLVEEWEFAERYALFHLREDFSWSDGEDLTAEDLVVQWEAYREGGHALWEFATDVYADGEYTLVVEYPEGTNTDIVRHAVLHENAHMPPQQWADYVGSGEPINEWTVEEPITSGPLELVERTDNYHAYAPRDDDHPYADNYNWSGYRMRRRQGNEDAYNSFVNQELDGIHSLYAGDGARSQFPDSLEEIRIPGTFGMGLWFNHDREPWSDRHVRQALAYSIDLEQVLFAAGSDTKVHHPVQTGLTAAAAESWFGGFDPGGFNAYEKDTEMAQALLEEAGLEGPGAVESDLVVPSGWSDWVLMAGNVVDQLAAAGWDIALQPLGGGYWAARGGDFDLICMEHSDGAQHNEAYFSLRSKLVAEAGNWPDNANYEPDEPVSDWFTQLATTQDEDEQTQLVRDLAELVNRDLPYLHVAQKYEQSFVDRESWEFPEGDHHLLRTQWPLWVLPKTDEHLEDLTGEVTPYGEPGLLKHREDPEPGCRVIAGDERCDLNGDGLYRDVTGDEELGQDDVALFFENQHREDWQRPEQFDYSGNGEVGHGDVVALFEDVSLR